MKEQEIEEIRKLREVTINHWAEDWYFKFSKFAKDLYPSRYTVAKCIDLMKLAIEIKYWAEEKESIIVAHNYLYPEFHMIADKVGDSLGLSLFVKRQKAKRVDFQSVYFMGETAKMITGNETRVFVSDKPEILGCSLVFGSDYDWILNWKKETGGILVTYINSTAYLKSISEFIGTSRNFDKVICEAAKMYPDKKILILPDKYLGYVMKEKAVDMGVKRDLIEVYDRDFNGERSCCYVHEKIGDRGLDIALLQYPDAELMIHPECGCASSCLLKVKNGIIPHERAYFLSTEGMVEHAKESSKIKFLVATEKGMLYRLRREVENKIFIPVSYEAECKYMKGNTLEKLLKSLQEDKYEIIICNDCCDPKNPYEDEKVIHLQKTVAEKAKTAIERMLAIK